MLCARIHLFSQFVLMNYPFVATVCEFDVRHYYVHGHCQSSMCHDNSASGSWLDNKDTSVSSSSDSDKEAAVNGASAPSCSPDTILQLLPNAT